MPTSDPAKIRDDLRRALRGSLWVIALGAALFGYAGWSGLHEWKFLAHAVHTQGTVTAVTVKKDEDHTRYFPGFSFADAKEQRWNNALASWDLGLTHDYRVGDAIPVVYNPDNPAEAQIDTGWTTWWDWKVLVAAMGLRFMISNFFNARAEFAALRRLGGR